MSGLNYPSTISRAVWGSVVHVLAADQATISTATRTSVTLESTYQAESTTVATKTLKVTGYSKLNLDVLYTMGAAETSNTIEIKVEGSPDGVNFYRLANESVSGATSTLLAREFTFAGVNADVATISIGLDIFYKYVRFSAKETGVASTKGTVYGEVTLLGL